MRDLAGLVIDMTGSASTLINKPLPQDDPRQRRPDITRAQAELGWTPKVDLRAGLQRTIAYFETLLSRFPASSTEAWGG